MSPQGDPARQDDLLKAWDDEIREHGIWTSGHSLGVRLAAHLREAQAENAQLRQQRDELVTVVKGACVILEPFAMITSALRAALAGVETRPQEGR